MTALQPTTAPHVRHDLGVALDGVTRSFAGRRVLGPIDLVLERGAVCLVQGANGAGKTTLLRVGAGLLAPTAGRRRTAEPALYLRSSSGMRGVQTVRQSLGWVARMVAGRGMAVAEALGLVGAAELADVRASALSSGQRARVSLAHALVATPAVVCLDEPSSHLDGAGQAALWRAVATLADSGTAVLLATHHADGLGELADARIELRRGVPGVVR